MKEYLWRLYQIYFIKQLFNFVHDKNILSALQINRSLKIEKKILQAWQLALIQLLRDALMAIDYDISNRSMIAMPANQKTFINDTEGWLN